MEKTRLSAIDILSLITSFNIHPSPTQPHYRLANIYSTNPTAAASSNILSTSGSNKHYLLKLGHSQKKLVIAIESGHRIHETLYKRDKEKTPNQLCLKLRKYIKGRRLDAIKQIGLDRVIYFDFGGYYLVMEFYAKGNIILTDENWKILCLLRRHDKGEEDVKYAVGETYPVELRKQYTPITRERIVESLEESKGNPQTTLLKFLNRCLDYGPDIIIHCLTKANIPQTTPIEHYIDNDANVDKLIDTIQEADRIVNILMNNVEQEGYIFLKPSPSDGENLNLTPVGPDGTELPDISDDLRQRYYTCHPILFEQYKNVPYIRFSSYNRAVDEYFSALDQQRVSNQKKNIEKVVNKKLDKIKKEQEDRVKNLEEDETQNHRHADLIACNLDLVDSAIDVIRTALGQSMDWEEIKDIIQQQRELGDPVANVIRKFDLKNNQIGVLLRESPESTPEIVTVNVTKSAYANVEDYYSRKKKANYKKEVTKSVQEKTLKMAEEKSKEKLILAQSAKVDITKMRKVFWFEKFNWFITSENFLVISGRDAHQNEIIVRRYLRKGDIYVHADIHGASTCIVKNPNPSVPIPQLSLNEACNYCVCRSKAWESKLGGLNAWWVYDDQVSKSAPTGEYLPTGSFMIRGKKNYIAHCPLIMGFGIMFRVTDEDVLRHANERRIRGTGSGGTELESEPSSAVSNIEDSIFESETNQAEVSEENQGSENRLNESIGNLSEVTEKTNNDDMNSENQHEDASDDEEEENGKKEPDDFKEGTLSHLEKLTKDYETMNEIQKKRTFNMKDKKLYKNLKKKGESEADAIQKTVETKLRKLKESIEKPQIEGEPEVQKTKKQKRVARTKKQKKIAAKLQEMDEEDKIALRQRLGIQFQPTESVKSEKEKRIEEKMQEERRKKREEKRLKQFFAEEKIPFMTEDERKKISEIDTLTGVPHPEDTILFAIPVCAPYNTLRQFKYKFKLTPGTSKRGKIAKTVYQIIQKMAADSTNKSEIEAIKLLSHDEMILSLIGNSQLSTKEKSKK